LPNKPAAPPEASTATATPHDRLLRALETDGESLIVTGLHGLAAAYHVARLARHQSPLLAVTADAAAAEALQRDLRFLLGRGPAVRGLPLEESSPYSPASPPLEVTGERLASLLALACGDLPTVIVTHAAALARRTLAPARMLEAALVLATGDEVGRDPLAATLARCGFSRVPLVEDPGTFAVRGSLIDVYVPGDERPVRVDLFGDVVDSLKHFDPASQRTGARIDSFAVGPVREVLFDPVAAACARERLQELADKVDFPTRKLRALLNDIDNGIPFFGVEALAPGFASEPRPSLAQALVELLGDGLRAVLLDGEAGRAALERSWDEMQEGYQEAIGRRRLAFPPQAHAEPPEAVWTALDARAAVRIEGLPLEAEGRTCIELHSAPTSDLTRDIERIAKRASAGETPEGLFEPVRARLDALRRDGYTTLLYTRGRGGQQRLRALFDDNRLQARVLTRPPDLLDRAACAALYDRAVHAQLCAVAELPSAGAIFQDDRIAVFTEEDIFGRRAKRRAAAASAPFRTTLADLNEGDVVVHVDFGVGLFRGLTRLNVRGVEGDYLLITYRGDDKLYLPVTRINLVQRYAGNEDHHPRLDKLGGQTWAKTKTRVKHAILAMAQELLALYARREVAVGDAAPAPDALFREFEGRFPFEETPDQDKAIADVLADMQQTQPMDRLVCGDVGYGKTEVAMRAAMLAALGGKQVAILAPTTVLAQQHFLTFSERFRGFPVQVEVISRLRRTGEVAKTLERVREGQVDVLIGTHRLLSHDVGFKRLGLLVVDEEHRFGVKDKERIKKLRTSVDVLALSATPIPRSLQMSFFGIRNLSVIDTPPADRRAIRTVVTRFDERVIRDAIGRELERGGQVYLVHNRIRSIEPLAAYVRKLVPVARVSVAHGQMKARQLEQVMLSFMRGETNVLVCTTIIESGIDIPRANTMLINRADMMGLAQLYQLRGRIGRSHERAFAYLMVPAASAQMSAKARKRLEVLTRFVELGAGFKIAQHDLELRGAGDLLGKSQHGHVAAVGYEMYAELLAEAVRDLQGRKEESAPEPELNVHVSAFIPDAYVPDIHERLAFYQRMATALDRNEVLDVLGGLEDRYGAPPPEVRNLAEVMVLKTKLKAFHARAIDLVAPREGSADPARVVLSLGDAALLDPGRLAAWVAEQPARLRLTPQMKLYLTAADADWLAAGEDIVELARRFLDEVKARAVSA